MMKARFLLLSIGLVFLAVSCKRDDNLVTVVYQRDDATFDARDIFPEEIQLTNSIWLDNRDSDGAILLKTDLPYSVVSYSLYPGKRSVKPSSAVSASMEIIPSGSSSIAFHLEFPRTIEWDLPEEILDIQAIRLISGILNCSLALGPDFPYKEAQLEQVSVTFPAWVRQTSGKQFDWNESGQSGMVFPEAEVLMWDDFDGLYTLGEGEGIQEPGHRLVLDATISIDGILSVDEKNWKGSQDASSPWSLTFTIPCFDLNCYFTGFTGRVDLSREMKDCSATISTIPSFMQVDGAVFDLDDVQAELMAYSYYPMPVSISGAFQGDDREYPFSTPIFKVPELNDPFHILLSEKGNRVKDGMNPKEYMEITIPGLSGVVDSDPVSFGVKNLRIATDPDTPQEYRFDEGSFIIQPILETPLRVGKDFQIGAYYVDLMLRGRKYVVKVSGSYTVKNTYPFDFEIRPVFLDWKEELPISIEPVIIPAGSRQSPHVQTVTFEWPVDASLSNLYLEVKGHTAEGRQGEDLYKDQYFDIKDISYEVLSDTEK